MQAIASNTGSISLPKNPRNINDVILEHENSTEAWEHSGIIKILSEWIERFNLEFKLKIVTPCVVIDKKSVRVLGTYRYGFNGIGTRNEITINSKHLQRPLFDILETLLHEMLHQWQDMHGESSSGNYHNKEYQTKAIDLGITSDHWGHSLGIIKNGAFEKMLDSYGVSTEGALYYNPERPKKIIRGITGNSKLKKWSCGCQNVWAGVKDFRAKCEVCLNRFVLVK